MTAEHCASRFDPKTALASAGAVFGSFAVGVENRAGGIAFMLSAWYTIRRIGQTVCFFVSDERGAAVLKEPELYTPTVGEPENELFREDPHAFLVMHNLYEAAVKQLTLKFEVLNSEFNVLYARNPIHHIESRVKSPQSIAAKLQKKGLPMTIAGAMTGVNDIAGVRVVCSYIDDVYRVAEMLERQTDVTIVKRQDYIRTPNYNGYRSLHLDIRVPVYLSNRTEYVLAEIQIRTIAMDFWASLEHDIRYKADKEKLPQGINEEMLECAGKIAEIDRQMQDMYQRIKAAQAGGKHTAPAGKRTNSEGTE